ncbi:MAG: YhgE/Pip domain-containing protein [Mogibacterium sp.]|nr:YhgE/Pip domain-containing protein [Mogibacterium sp.]
MKNILNIIRHDLKKITGSVVAIITIMGLCLVPCTYAWFNILSNWSPYESDATGRISVAIANIDEGTNVAGLTINVGDKIVEALQANNAIGWVFVDSEEDAIEDVRSGDCYAAIVFPEDFSRDVLSFAYGDLTNPTIKYYENEKKNAIAPKITAKAKNALQEEVNSAFIETLAGYVTDAASIADATGTDPAQLLYDLSDKADALGRDINSCIALSESAASLTKAADSLLDASGNLIDSTQDVLDENDKLLDKIKKDIPTQQIEEKAKEAREEASRLIDEITADLESLNDKVIDAIDDHTIAFDLLVDDTIVLVPAADLKQQKATEIASKLNEAGLTSLADEFTDLAAKYGEISTDLNSLSKDMSEEDKTAALNKLKSDIDESISIKEDIINQIRADVDAEIEKALSDTKNAIAAYRKSLKNANKDLGSLSSLMGRYGNSLGNLRSAVNRTTANLKALKDGSSALSGLLSNAAGSDLIQRLSDLMGNDEAAVAEYLANPIKMETVTFWPIENYGSSMAPFYTVLAQWVGALLTAVLIKVRVRKRDDLHDLKLHEWYFGRFGLYLLIGIAQALVVSTGDLLYVRIQCIHPLLFVLSAIVNSITFMMINYALVFALDNIGMGASVIILVLQVAGSGGTYPVEVLPSIFRTLNPFMPFRYAMGAMRECIGGMYDGVYWRCMGILVLIALGSVVFGMAFYRPARRLNEAIAASKEGSEIML